MHDGSIAPPSSPNRYISPDAGWRGWVQNQLANASMLRRARRALLSRLPFMVLSSDVRDIVYANWVVPVAKIAHLVPPAIPILDRDGHTILTILTYRHGHFGPALSGPLRRAFPSPLQSNWRLYLESDAGAGGKILFVSNIFDSALYAVGTRLFSDVLPSHRAAHFIHRCDTSSCFTEIGGAGSTPGVSIDATRHDTQTLPNAFRPFFSSWADAVRFLTLQHQAIAQVADEEALVFSDIDLPIDPDGATPLQTRNHDVGDWLKTLGAVEAPFCFHVPAVHFKALSERFHPCRHR